jgi:hypothetical protein
LIQKGTWMIPPKPRIASDFQASARRFQGVERRRCRVGDRIGLGSCRRAPGGHRGKR